MSYLRIKNHYENCLNTHGDSLMGVDWPKEQDTKTRHQIMYELLEACNASRQSTSKVLDFGCGLSHFYSFLCEKKDCFPIEYAGLDISQGHIDISREKFPKNSYYCVDILEDNDFSLECDFCTINGVFTDKRDLSFAEMSEFYQQVVSRLFKMTRKGLAFNVMSKQVDWEKDELFHLPLNNLAEFLCSKLTRNFIIRNDYGLYEYTVYVLK